MVLIYHGFLLLCQPALTVTVLKPPLIFPMRWILDALQFVQQDFEIIRGDNKFPDVIVNRVVPLANIFSDRQFSSAVVFVKVLGGQERPCEKFTRKF